MLIYGAPTTGKSEMRRMFCEDLAANLIFPDFIDNDDLLFMRGSRRDQKNIWHIRHRVIRQGQVSKFDAWSKQMTIRDMEFAVRCIGDKEHHFISNKDDHGSIADYAFLRTTDDAISELTNRYALEGKTPDAYDLKTWYGWKRPSGYKVDGKWSTWKNPIILPRGEYMSTMFTYNPKDLGSLRFTGLGHKPIGNNIPFRTPPLLYTDPKSGDTFMIVVHPKRSTDLSDLRDKIKVVRSQKKLTLVVLVDNLRFVDFKSTVLQVMANLSPGENKSIFIHGVQPDMKGGIPRAEIDSYMLGDHPSGDNVYKQGERFLGLINDNIAVLSTSEDLLLDRLADLAID